MKIRKSSASPSFTPFDLIFSVESREEAQALYAIFNYVPNLELLPIQQKLVVGEMLAEYANCHNNYIANNVTYYDFYRSKIRNLKG